MTEAPGDAWPDITPYENFLYLLAEMERSVERGNIEWPADQANVIMIRFERLALKLALAFGRDKTRPH